MSKMGAVTKFNSVEKTSRSKYTTFLIYIKSWHSHCQERRKLVGPLWITNPPLPRVHLFPYKLMGPVHDMSHFRDPIKVFILLIVQYGVHQRKLYSECWSTARFSLYAELQQQPALGQHGRTITEKCCTVRYEAWQRAKSPASPEQVKDGGVHSEYGVWKLTSSQPCQNIPGPIPSTSEH